MAVKIQLRRDLATNWGGSTVLASGEVGYETDTGNIKIGDGTTQWSALAYYQLPNVSVSPATTVDLNNSAYRAMGRYRLNSVTGGSTFTNAPSDLDTADADSYCAMIVTSHAYTALSTLIQQTLTQFSGNGTTLKQWVRMYDGTNWTAWTSTAHLSDGEVTTATLASSAVTYAKLASDILQVLVPVGSVLPYAGSSAPSSQWLVCNGSLVSRTTYSALFTVLSTNFGAGDGSTTFNLPDLRGRTAVGVNTATYLTTLGATIGSADAIVVSHNHGFTGAATSTDGSHTHYLAHSQFQSDANSYITGAQYIAYDQNSGISRSYRLVTSVGGAAPDVGIVGYAGGHSHSTAGTVGTTGSSGTNQNFQPSIALNYIIRAL